MVQDYMRNHELWSLDPQQGIWRLIFNEVVDAAQAAIGGHSPPTVHATTARDLLEVAEKEAITGTEKAVVGELRWIIGKRA